LPIEKKFYQKYQVVATKKGYSFPFIQKIDFKPAFTTCSPNKFFGRRERLRPEV
jgi:hypothetical protein